MQNNDLKLRIILQRPPAGVDFGVQKGAGAKYSTVQTQRSDGQDLKFEVTIQVKGEPQKRPDPLFVGSFAQGRSPEQFLYIDIGELAGQVGGWCRRLKIPFTGITWDLVALANSDPDSVLETNVPGKAKDGGPNCATVKPFGGWKLHKSPSSSHGIK